MNKDHVGLGFALNLNDAFILKNKIIEDEPSYEGELQVFSYPLNKVLALEDGTPEE